MKRRRFLLGALGLLSSGTAARAQEPGRVYRLGVLFDAARDDPGIVAGLDELHRSGFVEGQNLRVEGRFSIRDEETAEVAARLVATGVDVIWTGAYPRTRAAQQATPRIPTITLASDPVPS